MPNQIRRCGSRFLAGLVLSFVAIGVAMAQTLDDAALQIETVVTGLSLPTTMEFLGPGDILVLQKNDGKVRRVIDGVLQAQAVLDVHVNTSSERGLLGIAINTQIPPKVFLYYTEATGNDGGAVIANRVYRYHWNPGTGLLESPLLILDLPVLNGPNHDGGILELGPPTGAGVGDGAPLYAIIGDLNREGQLQNYANGAAPDDSGVVLRVQQDGTPYPGNPFTPYCSITTATTCSANGDCPGGETCITEVARYFAYGIRNSFGMALDGQTGLLWDTENGPRTNDEVNVIAPGFNSGWEDQMGPFGSEIGPAGLWDVPGAGNTYSDPEFTWTDTNAPTAILFPVGTAMGAAYDGSAMVGDNNPGNLYLFPLNGPRSGFDFNNYPNLGDRVADDDSERDELRLGTGFGAVTDLKVGPDGGVYVVSIANGAIYRISAADPIARAGMDRSIAPTHEPLALGDSPAAWGGTPPYDYSWAISPGTEGVDYLLSSSTEANPVFTGITLGTYTATLTVTDDDSDVGVDAALITVGIPDQFDLSNENLSGTLLYQACLTITAESVVIEAGADVTFHAPFTDFIHSVVTADSASLTVINTVPAGCP